MVTHMIRFMKEDEGATIVEYGLLVGLVAIFLIGVLTTFRDEIESVFNEVGSDLATAETSIDPDSD